MRVTAGHIRAILADYLGAHPDQTARLTTALDLLDAGADLSDRTEFRGHATAGAILANPDRGILHVRHLALDRWLLPGGHLENNDGSLLHAALRELTEETGIPLAAIAAAGPGRCTSTSTRSPPTTRKASPSTNTSISGSCSAPRPTPPTSTTRPSASRTKASTPRRTPPQCCSTRWCRPAPGCVWPTTSTRTRRSSDTATM